MPTFAENTWLTPNMTEFQLRLVAGLLIFLCTTVVSYILGNLVGRYRAWREWAGKRFSGRINIGVNSLSNGVLKLRSLTEKSLEEVFLNPVAIEKVRAAAAQTTVENPLLPLQQEDCWFLLNFVLSSFSERFCEGVLRFDAGQPVQTVRYVLFLTSEKVGDDRIHKVRALLIQEELLRNFPYHESMPQLETPDHADRVVTLRVAARSLQTHPHYFMRVELYL